MCLSSSFDDCLCGKHSSLFHMIKIGHGAVLITAPLISVNSNDSLMEGNGGKQMVWVANFPLRYCGMSILTSHKSTCILSAEVEK